MPDTYCCPAVRRYLIPIWAEGGWRWVIKPRYWSERHNQVAINCCPWCGKQLPAEGRLKVVEVNHGTGNS